MYADKLIEQSNTFMTVANRSKIDMDVTIDNIAGITSVLTIVGVAILMICIAVVGIQYLNASPEEVKKYKDKLIGLLIAGVILAGSVTIWSISIDIIRGLVNEKTDVEIVEGPDVQPIAPTPGVYGDDGEITSISFNPSEITLNYGDKQKLDPIIEPPEGAPVAKIRYTSDDPSVASVDNGGKVEAVGVGTTYILAKTKNGKEAVVKVTVGGQDEYFCGYKQDIDAWLYVPHIEDVKTYENIPLIVYLRGGLNLEKTSGESITNESLPAFIKNGEVTPKAIVVAPRVPSVNIRTLISSLKPYYDINNNKISITGHSTGAYYSIKNLKNDPDLYSAGVVISLRYKGSQYWVQDVKCPTKFVFEQSLDPQAGEICKAVMSLVDNNNFTTAIKIPGTNHGSVTDYYKTTDVISWMISQTK